MTDEATFFVVSNQSGDISLWPDHLPVPAGWKADGFQGSEDACVAYVDDRFSTDPKSENN